MKWLVLFLMIMGFASFLKPCLRYALYYLHKESQLFLCTIYKRAAFSCFFTKGRSPCAPLRRAFWARRFRAAPFRLSDSGSRSCSALLRFCPGRRFLLVSTNCLVRRTGGGSRFGAPCPQTLCGAEQLNVPASAVGPGRSASVAPVMGVLSSSSICFRIPPIKNRQGLPFGTALPVLDLFHCFDRISSTGVHRLFRGCISIKGGANGKGGSK